jgi:hypothetical protein
LQHVQHALLVTAGCFSSLGSSATPEEVSMNSFPFRTLFPILLLTAASLAHAQSAADFFDDRIMQDIRLEVSPADWATLQAH